MSKEEIKELADKLNKRKKRVSPSLSIGAIISDIVSVFKFQSNRPTRLDMNLSLMDRRNRA